jgi:hypothetical protein
MGWVDWLVHPIRSFRKRSTDVLEGPSLDQLREFIYLDETSVYSLIASKLGPIKAEVTESSGVAQTAAMNGKVGGDLKVLKGEISSRIEDSRTSTTQVVRRSNVQATFKELRDLEADMLRLRSVPASSSDERSASNLDELLTARAAICADDLFRGDLLEFDVHLRVEDVYEIKAIFESMSSLGDIKADMFGEGARHLGEVSSLSAILERLLVGLVPLRGVAEDHVIGEVDGRTYIIERQFAGFVSELSNVRSLIVVGVVDEANFWKDLRRVLFSDLVFRIFARVVSGGVAESWTPVKMLDVMGRVTPQLRDQMNIFSASAITAMASAASTHKSAESKAAEYAVALQDYAFAVCSALKVDLDPVEKGRIRALAVGGSEGFNTAHGRREAFRRIDEVVMAKAVAVPEDWADQALVLRTAATPEDEVLPASAYWKGVGAGQSDSLASIVEVEIVAIYW